MLITLNETDLALAAEVAQQRNLSQRQAGRQDGLVKGDSLERDIQGAEAELAVSRALQLPWEGKFLPINVWDKWKHLGNDVGRLEVRSTNLPTGRLILHHGDKDKVPYLLVISSERPIFNIVGWMFGEDGKQKKYWCKHVPRPCFLIPQNHLRNMEELLNLGIE